MSDRKSPTVEERVVALLKANRKDLRAFVRAVEALVPPDGDVAGFLDEMGASLASDDRTIGALELWDKAAKMYEDQARLEELADLYANMGPIAARRATFRAASGSPGRPRNSQSSWTPTRSLSIMSLPIWEPCTRSWETGRRQCMRTAALSKCHARGTTAPGRSTRCLPLHRSVLRGRTWHLPEVKPWEPFRWLTRAMTACSRPKPCERSETSRRLRGNTNRPFDSMSRDWLSRRYARSRDTGAAPLCHEHGM